eukprot:2614925-Lingulodinium_polyedra.AAC.1
MKLFKEAIDHSKAKETEHTARIQNLNTKYEYEVLELQARLDKEEETSRKWLEELMEYQEKEWALQAQHAPPFVPAAPVLPEHFTMHSDTEVQNTTLAGRGIGYPSLLSGGACPPGSPTFPSGGVGASTWLPGP